MSFAWFSVPVTTCFGTVASLNWDYAGGDDDDDTTTSGEASTAAKRSDPARGKPRRLSDDEQRGLDDAEDELGAVLWNSNVVCCEEVQRLQRERGGGNLKNWNVLELGAGVGAAGVAIAKAGARVLITDIPRLEGAMKATVKLNPDVPSDRIAVAGFDWMLPVPPAVLQWLGGCAKGSTLLLLMCDALYGNPKCWPQLINRLNAIHEHAASRGVAVVGLNLCEQRVTGVEDGFFELLRADANGWTATTRTLDTKSELSLPVRTTTFSISKPVAATKSAANEPSAAERTAGEPGHKRSRREE